jgi:general secretion pathway protein F
MPDFQYTARETSGQQMTGLLTASSKQDALNTLASRSLFPLRIDLAESTKSAQKHVVKRVSPRHLCVFYTQLTDLLKSGVPLLRSLELLAKQSVNSTLKLVIQDVLEQVANGAHLAESMRAHPKVFSELAVSMIRAGEEGSFLEEVLKRIAIFTEHQEELKSRVVGAMVYPLFLLVMGCLIVSGMLIFFVPEFEPIFQRMGERGELPWATTTLLSFSNFAQQSWMLGFAGLAFGLFLLVQWIKTAEGHLQADKFRLKAPGIGPIVRSLAVARFCRILGTLLRNGVPILQSLRIAKDATGNIVLSEAISTAADNISEGKSLARPLEASGQFPEEVVEMIYVGEEANNLEQVLIDVADSMERRTNRLLEMFVRLLEPALLTVMAGIILFVVIALLLPIMQSSTAL